MPHFEIHAADVGRARRFYGGLFGWSFTPMTGGEEVEYHLIEGDGLGPGKALTAGIMRRVGPTPAPGSPIRGGTMTFEVGDCDERYAWALANGGAEALPPTDYPGIGRVAYVEDGEGNVVGMITPAAEEN
ncbi:MAG: VOC family protein [Alphaproteobacteria bacterium]|nr:MAG: VOC family protein [Alphaproteobacteria bacterium]